MFSKTPSEVTRGGKPRRASEKLSKRGARKGTRGQGAQRAGADERSCESVDPPYRAAGLQAAQAPSGPHTLGRPSRTVPGRACVTRGCGPGDGGHARGAPTRLRTPAPGWPAGGGGGQVSGCADTREGVTERPGDGCNANSVCRHWATRCSRSQSRDPQKAGPVSAAVSGSTLGKQSRGNGRRAHTWVQSLTD